MPDITQAEQSMRGRKPQGAGDGVHPAVQTLADAARAAGISRRRLAVLAGVSLGVPTAWYSGDQAPRLDLLEQVLRSLGYTLVAVPLTPPARAQVPYLTAHPVVTPLAEPQPGMPAEDMA